MAVMIRITCVIIWLW
uniref:Uncharacterized protein n=1 Tax=Arundo donax TaxID=35708 RepID=A0A0A9BIP4_ARUDO